MVYIYKVWQLSALTIWNEIYLKMRKNFAGIVFRFRQILRKKLSYLLQIEPTNELKKSLVLKLHYCYNTPAATCSSLTGPSSGNTQSYKPAA